MTEPATIFSESVIWGVRERREPQCSGRDNLGTLAIAAAAVESAARGETVRVLPTAD